MVFLFDLGGVLYQIDKEVFKKTFLSHVISHVLPSELERASLFKEYETGRISTSDFITSLQRKYFPHLSSGEIIKIWNSILVGNHPYAEELISRLKEHNHRIFLLSNTNELHYQKLYPEARIFLDLFDGIFLSYELGISKPDKAIFEQVRKRIGVPSEEVLFFDDSPENVQSAKEAGFQTRLITREKDIEFYLPAS